MYMHPFMVVTCLAACASSNQEFPFNTSREKECVLLNAVLLCCCVVVLLCVVVCVVCVMSRVLCMSVTPWDGR